MEYIHSKDIFRLIRDTLKMADKRVIEHGSRVAYYFYKMLDCQGGYEKFELADFVFLASFHDIGAYKTNNLKDFVGYEFKAPMPHTTYGYLIFKHLSPLKELASVILYHHTNFLQLKGLKYESKDIAGLLNYAEKIDIFSRAMKDSFNMSMIQKQVGAVLDPSAHDLFRKVMIKEDVLAKVKSGEYLEELEEIAVNAYRWNSHDPGTRAETDIMGYEKQLHEDLKKIPEAKKQDYINTYKSKISVLFHSLSRCANPMVTGRGGFNFQRNEKAQNAYQNRYDEFLKWREKFLKTMQLLTEKDRPEEEKREETWRRLKHDIASSANTIHEIDTGKARGYNRALFVSSIFNKVSTFAGHGDVEIVQKAIDFISEYNAGIKKPVITPRHRFFQLPETASRMRDKLKETREQENREVTFEGGTLVWNYQESRLQILFNKIPEESKRRELKSSGFHWSPRNRAWQRQLNTNAVSAAKRILNLQNI